MSPLPAGRIAVVGGGMTGLAATFEASQRVERVVLFEAADRLGGRVATGPFAGVDHVDSGADAFLARVPDATRLAAEVGLGDHLVHPERVGAAVWYDRLHDIPDGLVLGVPGDLSGLVRSGLIGWRGTARAALEPLLPRSSRRHDSIGRFVRARFGDQVHERLVDALVGSIYAADTDRFSLAEVPQLAALAEHRSVLLAARRLASANAGTASAGAAPVFAVPRDGMAALAAATAQAAAANAACAVEVRLGTRATVERDGPQRWRVAGESFDAVILAVPPAAIPAVVAGDAGTSEFARTAAAGDTADVVMVTLHIAPDEWPERLRGRSGYLVPKPVQRDVTAVSFGSQKWAHWTPPDGGQILRVSMGRDGVPVLQHDDDEIVGRVLDDLRRHLGVGFTPREVRITRWPGAFAQYRPHHRTWVQNVRGRLPSGLFVAGAGFDGIGVPACIRSGRTIAERAAALATSLPD